MKSMEKENLRVVGILVHQNVADIKNLHNILSSFGNVIRSRLGLNNPLDDDKVHGLMILELKGSAAEMDSLLVELQGLDGVQVQQMIFN